MDSTKITRPARKLLKLKRCGAVIVAAGTASRMGGIDKVMAPIQGEPMIARTVRQFQNCDAISEIVIVTREDLIQPITGLCKAMDKVTADGVITVEESKSAETYSEVVEGMQFDRGYLSPYMVTDSDKMASRLLARQSLCVFRARS